MKIFLFGSKDIYGVPESLVRQLEMLLEQTNGNLQFIVGDCSGIDASFHTVLSMIGARSKTTIYCMDYARNNRFEFETKVFNSDGMEGRELYEYKDRQMCKDCDIAVTVWDGKSRGTFNCITILKAQDKPVYVFTVAQ